MKKRALIIALVVVVATLFVVAPAFAGQQTRIMYANMNVDVYEYTPAATGYLWVSIGWSNPDGTGTPQWPISEVDGAVQTFDSASGEIYYDVDVAGLYAATGNPQIGQFRVLSGGVGKTCYISVVPFIGDVPYRLIVRYGTSSQGQTNPVVLDTGAIDVSNPAQKWAYGVHGVVNVPSTGTWKSVAQYWPGTMNRGTGVSDVWANWDDYAFDRATYTQLFANEWANTNYYPPVSSTTTIASGGGPTVPKPGWVYVCPEIWTAAARPNVWTNIATDIYPKPGSLSATAAPLWHTYSFPDNAKAATPVYTWGMLNNTSASKRSFSLIGDRSTQLTHTFYGDSITWLYTKWNRGGIARVYIDDVDKGTIDQYSSSFVFKASQTYSGLGNSAHTIRIVSDRTKNPSSLAYWTTHDAFIAATDAADPVPTDPRENNYDGSSLFKWGVLSNASASGGSFALIGDRAAALAFSFEGTSIDWKYTKWNRGGIARVYVDGIDKGTVDQYSSSFAFQQTSTYSGLGAGWHTIMIVSNKTKNASSLAYWTTHDAFVVGATTFEN